MNRQLLAAASALASVATAFAAPAVEGKTFPLSATVPAQSSVDRFVDGRFKQTVTCRTACTVVTKVSITSRVARRLGFRNVKGKVLIVATSKASLKARTPTKLRFVLTAEAKRRLPKARSAVRIAGVVQSFPRGRPGVNYSLGWSSMLT